MYCFIYYLQIWRNGITVCLCSFINFQLFLLRVIMGSFMAMYFLLSRCIIYLKSLFAEPPVLPRILHKKNRRNNNTIKEEKNTLFLARYDAHTTHYVLSWSFSFKVERMCRNTFSPWCAVPHRQWQNHFANDRTKHSCLLSCSSMLYLLTDAWQSQELGTETKTWPVSKDAT